jgi:predicted nucleic acid-binding protein
MGLVADSGCLLALYDADDRHHAATAAVVDAEAGPLIIPVAILAEVDYLLRKQLGTEAESVFLSDLASGAFTLEPFHPEDLKRCRELIGIYRELDLGIADAAVIATAERRGIDRILTLDLHDFRVVRNRRGRAFTLLPADA